jgi:aspartate/methionine/tyrosine aminotransferase
MQEEFFERYEFACRYMLAGSGVAPLSYAELSELASDTPPAPLAALGYTPSAGYLELREEIASMYVGAAAENVLVTVGAIEALMIATNLLLNPDEKLVCLWPSYQPLYEHAKALGARVRFVELDDVDGFAIDPTRIVDAVGNSTRLVMLNVPHNPTGATLSAAELRRLVDALAPRGVHVIVDEVFREMWPRHEQSAWNGAPNLVVLGSLSKCYGLPGLRIGWMLAPPDLIVEARRFRKYTSLNPGSLDQEWALRALRARERLLARTHRMVSDGLAIATAWLAEHEDIFRAVPPRGGGLIFPRLLTGEPTRDFCVRVVERTGVLLAPGSECYAAEGFLRLGYATPELADGLDRLAECL